MGCSEDEPGHGKDLCRLLLNPGILATKEDEISLTFSVRSSVASEKEELYERLVCLTESLGGKVNRSSDYPAWEYVEDSKLRILMGDTYREMYKKRACNGSDSCRC